MIADQDLPRTTDSRAISWSNSSEIRIPFALVAIFPPRRSVHTVHNTMDKSGSPIESRRPGPDEMVEIFARVGLEGPFWDPKADQC